LLQSSVALPTVAATRVTAALPRRVLQQRRSVVATHAATATQRCRDASYSIRTLQACYVATSQACSVVASRACSAEATRACTAATPRYHRHRHKAHG